MKTLLTLFAVGLLIGCDDGDVTISDINFDQVQAVKCSDNEIVYKLNKNQILLMQLDAAQIPFENNPGIKTLSIGGVNQVRYRFYNATANADNVCADIQPALPIVTEEWIATSGLIEINTTQVLTEPDAITGATRIDHYNHSIVFRNIIFSKPNGNQVYEVFSFGDYVTQPTTLPFDFAPEEVALCPLTNTLYNAKSLGREGLFVQNFDPALFSTAASDLNVPKAEPVSETSNKLIYRLFRSQLANGGNENYFCSTAIGLPEVAEEWTAVSGNIVVTTSAEGSGFRHVIRLQNIVFTKGNSSFYYGNDILYGQLLTN